MYPYVIRRMYLYAIRMSLACICMSLVCRMYVPVCHSLYVLICYSYVTRMYSYATRMSLVYTRMLLVCQSYVLACHLYVFLPRAVNILFGNNRSMKWLNCWWLFVFLCFPYTSGIDLNTSLWGIQLYTALIYQ